MPNGGENRVGVGTRIWLAQMKLSAIRAIIMRDAPGRDPVPLLPQFIGCRINLPTNASNSKIYILTPQRSQLQLQLQLQPQLGTMDSATLRRDWHRLAGARSATQNDDHLLYDHLKTNQAQ